LDGARSEYLPGGPEIIVTPLVCKFYFTGVEIEVRLEEARSSSS